MLMARAKRSVSHRNQIECKSDFESSWASAPAVGDIKVVSGPSFFFFFFFFWGEAFNGGCLKWRCLKIFFFFPWCALKRFMKTLLAECRWRLVMEASKVLLLNRRRLESHVFVSLYISHFSPSRAPRQCFSVTLNRFTAAPRPTNY